MTCWAMPKSVQRWPLNMSHSSKESGSSSTSMRSRAVSLPLACWASMRRWPPPRRAAARFSSSWRMMSCIGCLGAGTTDRLQDLPGAGGDRRPGAEDAGHPGLAEELVVLRGDHPADEDEDVAGAPALEGPHQRRDQRPVAGGQG